MSGRHGREAYYIAGEGMRCLAPNGTTTTWTADSIEESTQFRFSRFVPGLVGAPISDEAMAQLAVAMTHAGRGTLDPNMPAGYTYLGQFVDHDMTLDPSELDLRSTGVLPLQSMRSPTLDLDSLYGKGPVEDPAFYGADGARLITGRPFDVTGGAAAGDGYDLPRRGPAADGKRGTEREAKIPDIRNDENLAVAQVHASFIRLHNKVVDDLVERRVPSALLYESARALVTKHYQWMLRHDYLPRIVDPAIVDDVFRHGRRLFETGDAPRFGTMPVEFSGAAFRLGHSMIRTVYQWNRFFHAEPGRAGRLDSGHLFRLFRFSGTSGTLMPVAHAPGSPDDLADLENPPPPPPGTEFGRRLPSNWVANMTWLFDFSRFAAVDPAFVPGNGDFNHATAIDTHLVDPLATLPIGSFGAASAPLLKKRNLAFRNLARGRMLGLPSGQQMASAFTDAGLNTPALTADQLRDGNGGIVLTKDEVPQLDEVLTNTPLWFYVLREAEFHNNRLGPVGGRIVAETFHRAMQSSAHSMLADAGFKPSLGPGRAVGRCQMEDLLHHAFDGRPDLLSPLG